MSKKRKRSKKDYDSRQEETLKHAPKDTHSHIAREYRETRGLDEAENLCRGLLPHMKDRALGNPKGLSRQKNWSPSVKEAKL